MSDDQPFYAPGRKPPPPRQPAAGEPIWTLHKNAEIQSCELRDQGAAGFEVQLLRNGSWFLGQLYPTRARALEEAAAAKKLAKRTAGKKAEASHALG